MRYFLLLFLTAFFTAVHGQPTHYVDSLGKIYWKKSQPLYLLVADNPEGMNSKRLTSERTKQYSDPLFLDTEGVNYIRTRNAVDPETKRVIPNTEVMFEIYSDGTPPTTSTSLTNTAVYRDGNSRFYKGNVEVTLSATDRLSGVHDIRYSINDEERQEYTEPLYFNESGKFSIKYASRDEVGNEEEVRELLFYIDETPPYSDLNVNGITDDNVIASTSKLYIQAYDSLSGIRQVFYRFDDGEYQTYQGGLVPISQLDEGDHSITYYAIDHVDNTEEAHTFEFYIDKSAPIMVADVLGDRFIVGDEIYFSGRTKLKLTAVDNKVGVKEIKYSIDDGEYKTYTDPIYLPSVSGVHSIRFYSVDNLNNSTADSRKSRYLGSGGVEEYKHNVSKIYVDLTGPAINYSVNEYSFVRNDTLYIGPNTSIELAGEDGESGFKQINYSLNSDLGETPYTGAFTLASRGYNVLHIYGYDNVNNRNVDDLPFFMDDTGPEVFTTFSTGSTGQRKEVMVYPDNAGIYLSATDQVAGVKTLQYQLDDGPLTSYAGLITNLERGKHTIKVIAEDYLKNQAEENIEFIIR